MFIILADIVSEKYRTITHGPETNSMSEEHKVQVWTLDAQCKM